MYIRIHWFQYSVTDSRTLLTVEGHNIIVHFWLHCPDAFGTDYHSQTHDPFPAHTHTHTHTHTLTGEEADTQDQTEIVCTHTTHTTHTA